MLDDCNLINWAFNIVDIKNLSELFIHQMDLRLFNRLRILTYFIGYK